MAVTNNTTRPTNSTTQTSSSTSSQQRHTVRNGENLWSIAQQHSGGRTNAEVSRYHQELIKANPQLRDPNLIRPGQELNLPDAASVNGGRSSRIKPATANSTQSAYEPSSSAPPPQTARPDPTASSATHPPVSQDLSDEVTARRTAANTNPGVRRGRAPTADEDEETTQAQNGTTQPSGTQSEHQSVMGRPDFGKRNMPNSNIYGNNVRRGVSREAANDGGTLRNHDETVRTQNRGAEQYRDTNSQTTETTADGQRTTQLEEENLLRNRRTGEQLREHTTVAQDQDGNFGSRTTDTSDGPDDRSTAERLVEENGPNAVTATGVLAQQRIAGDDDWHGVATSNDTRHTEDRTGGGYEAHALAYRANADAAATVDLQNGEVNVGVQGQVQADLVGASTSGQIGTRNSTAGAVYGEAEAHIGARAEGGASLVVSPDNIGVRAGGEVFAGAEVKGTAGYENRYGGVSVTGRAQAGAGAAAGIDVGYRNGTVGFHADLGATLGIGGRLTVDVNVNVGAIAQDAGRALSSAADTVSEAASDAWSAINPFD